MAKSPTNPSAFFTRSEPINSKLQGKPWVTLPTNYPGSNSCPADSSNKRSKIWTDFRTSGFSFTLTATRAGNQRFNPRADRPCNEECLPLGPLTDPTASAFRAVKSSRSKGARFTSKTRTFWMVRRFWISSPTWWKAIVSRKLGKDGLVSRQRPILKLKSLPLFRAPRGGSRSTASAPWFQQPSSSLRRRPLIATPNASRKFPTERASLLFALGAWGSPYTSKK